MTVEELEAAFIGIDLPEEAELYPGVIVRDVPKFIASHIATIKNASNARMSDAFVDRLVRLLDIIEQRDKAE
ncbi:DUF6965 family protein [Pedobacter psychroterrae]|uniref:DUF6965 domain-containing protein n=1 Tax=Pedobacter psychroterrae TaxID=2530453 RepID=A0A4R0NLY3_9SPHI|nr:hypothetical protein [Pedobacter psychroterrae]TCD00055.1 hypothetical protein EZ437_15155 [Pedobacter psychroterrae]